MLTNEERDIVRTAVILPMMIQMLEKDIEGIEQAKQTFRTLFVKSAELLRDRVNADLLSARRELSKRGIKVIEEEAPRTSKRWKMIQRGSEETMEILRPTIRSDIGERIAAYNEGMFNVMPGPIRGNLMEGFTRDGEG